VVVAVGLFMAFQADRWWEQRDERKQEHAYIERLIADFQMDVAAIEYAIEIAQLRLSFVHLLMDVSRDPETALKQPAVFLSAIEQAAYTYTPSLTSHTFEDLRSTGNMRLVRNLDIKNALYDYYGFDASQRQYRPLQFFSEFNYFELSAGVRSLQQSVFIQDTDLIISPDEIERIKAIERDPEAIMATAVRLTERTDMINWLPQLRSLQLEQIEVHIIRLEKANTVLKMLQNSTTGIVRQ